MPLVFVHGVATRQTPEYKAWVHQRDTLFRRLVLPKNAAVHDPDWGSNAVKFSPTLPWLPQPGSAQPFAFGRASGTDQSGIGGLAAKNPEAAIDVAFEAGLRRVRQRQRKPATAGDRGLAAPSQRRRGRQASHAGSHRS
jgi:hypothetical protein